MDHWDRSQSRRGCPSVGLRGRCLRTKRRPRRRWTRNPSDTQDGSAHHRSNSCNLWREALFLEIRRARRQSRSPLSQVCLPFSFTLRWHHFSGDPTDSAFIPVQRTQQQGIRARLFSSPPKKVFSGLYRMADKKCKRKKRKSMRSAESNERRAHAPLSQRLFFRSKRDPIGPCQSKRKNSCAIHRHVCWMRFFPHLSFRRATAFRQHVFFQLHDYRIQWRGHIKDFFFWNLGGI